MPRSRKSRSPRESGALFIRAQRVANLLRDRRWRAVELADELGCPLATTKRILVALRRVYSEDLAITREGREIYYRLPPEIMVTISEETFRWLGREPSKKAREILERARERAR